MSPASRHSRRAWKLAWFGGAALGTTNGIARETLLGKRLDARTANQVSVASLCGLLACEFVLLQRRWPLPTSRDALSVGRAWVVLTVLFEFGFGHYVDRKSWSELLENYDVRKGNLWPVVLLWMSIGPGVVRELAPGQAE
jgi:hypothetical protein